MDGWKHRKLQDNSGIESKQEKTIQEEKNRYIFLELEYIVVRTTIKAKEGAIDLYQSFLESGKASQGREG